MKLHNGVEHRNVKHKERIQFIFKNEIIFLFLFRANKNLPFLHKIVSGKPYGYISKGWTKKSL